MFDAALNRRADALIQALLESEKSGAPYDRERVLNRTREILASEEDETPEHSAHCSCRSCDPDFYNDPAERDVGVREVRW